jgi:streptogramin lyase
MKKQLITLLCLAIAALAYAQEEKVDQIDLSGILNGPFDIELAEAGNGNIWAIHSFIGNGLETALMMYDGENWSAQEFPCSTCLRDIEIDKDGNLWAAANTEGIYKFENSTWTQVLSNSAIKLAFLSNGNLKFVNTDGVFTYQDGQVMEGDNTNKPTFFSFKGFEMDNDDNLWMLKSDEIYQYNSSQGWVYRNESFNPELIELGPDNKVWVAENTGAISYFENGNYNFNQVTGVFPMGLKATALTVDHENNLWVGIQGDNPGITMYNDGSVKKYSSESLVGASNPLSKIFVTSNGEVWAFENYNNTIGHIYEGEASTVDADEDGFNSDVDCDDNNAAINPEAEEIPNNDIDENCDGEIVIIDVDKDGFNSDVDCDDLNAGINPDAQEVPNNDIDENCDGVVMVIDNDQDGFNSDLDCDDNNALINPDAEEIVNNTIDENCDGVASVIDLDQDGYNSDVDCDDTNALINPGAVEIVNNGIDENCDGADLTSSVEEFDPIRISISPNPSNGNSRIAFSDAVVDGRLSIFSIDGRLVKSIAPRQAMQYIDINTSNYQKGIYIIKLIAKNNEYTSKLVVE